MRIRAHAPRIAALLSVAAISAAVTAGCGAPPTAHAALAMESIGLPGTEPLHTMRLRVGEAGVLVEEAILVEAENPALLRAYAETDTLAVIGRRIGTTTVRIVRRDGETSTLRVTVGDGDASPYALSIGDTFVLGLKDVREYSIGLPGIVAVTPTSDGTELVVTGRKAGATTLVTFDAKGRSTARELLVVGGQRMEVASARIDTTP